MFGTINKRRNPNKHWGGWKKNSKFRKPGGSLFSTQAYFEMQVLSLPCKEKKFTWIFFCIMRKTSLKKLLILLFDYFLQIKVLQLNSQLIN